MLSDLPKYIYNAYIVMAIIILITAIIDSVMELSFLHKSV